MAYASFYDTHVTQLRFKCLEWSVYLNSLNRDIDFQIYEDKENMKIDFEIVLRNTQGVNINSFLVNDIDVCCDIGQIDRLFKTELFPLSSCQVIILIARMTFNCFPSCLMS